MTCLRGLDLHGLGSEMPTCSSQLYSAPALYGPLLYSPYTRPPPTFDSSSSITLSINFLAPRFIICLPILLRKPTFSSLASSSQLYSPPALTGPLLYSP